VDAEPVEALANKKRGFDKLNHQIINNKQ